MKREITDKFVVRLPRPLHDQIASLARMYRRSMNSEIVLRLQYSISGPSDPEREKALEPEMFPQIERIIRGDLTEEEQRLLICFRRMTPDRRAALYSLIT